MWFSIDFGSHVPVYKQIMEKIKAMIKSGELKKDEFVPSIRNLAETLQVNINTVARAYRELTNEGVLKPVRGEGYVVGELNEQDFLNQLLAQFDHSVLECKKVGIDQQLLIERLREVYRRDDNGTKS